MTLKKIRDADPLLFAGHNAPLEAGTYQYTCPNCGAMGEFDVALTTNGPTRFPEGQKSCCRSILIKDAK